MNREIKYRIWDEGYQQMCQVDMITFGDNDLPVKAQARGLTSPFGYRDVFIEENPLLEFTGLKDKNGTPIYEGDILSGHSDGNVKVEWSNDNGGWECIFNDEANIGIAEMCVWFGNSSIVIGNIYQNPELINQTK